jgi:formylglycine-generating enzyme required for sulfatase activity
MQRKGGLEPVYLLKLIHMKRICTLLAGLFLIASLSAQTTGPDKKRVNNNPATVNSAISPATSEIIKAIESRMVKVEGGAFNMGCADDTDCYYWEKPAHKVIISPFYIGKFPVMQMEWEAIMGTKPWFSKDCPECPVENVSWYDAQMFISKLNQLSGKYYRLPTEAEWEYAARGGVQSKGYKYAGDNNLNAVAWYGKNSGQQSHPVGQKKPNELGLYDMNGNVWQWCNDWFGDNYYSKSPTDNPQGPGREEYRTCRGGSWWSAARDCAVNNRDRYPPDARDDDVGFRLVME